MKTQNEKDLISLSRVLANFLNDSVDHFEALPIISTDDKAQIDANYITELTNTLLAAQASLLDFVVRSAVDDGMLEDEPKADKQDRGSSTLH